MGKGGGALSMWIKEFTALVFTQTIQAFIYAIILSIILFGMGGNNSAGVSPDDNNSALGLMSVFALLSVFKVEEMSKKIFGIGDTKASHGNAMRSIAKTALAAQLGKRVLNNAGKVFGGIKSINQAGQDRRKAQKRFQEDLADEGYELKNGKLVATAGKGSTQAKAHADASASGYKAVNTGSTATRGEHGESVQVGSTAAGGNDSEMSKAAYRRVKNALRTYEDKASEINKARNEGWKNIASGIMETQGAIFGATTGAVLGGADGNLDEALQGMVAGAGVGDAMAESAVNAIDKATQFVKRNANRQAGLSNRKLQQSISAYKDALGKANVNYSSSKVDDIDI